MYFQDLILALQRYWNDQGCLLTQPYDIETGAGTFNPSTFLRSLGPEPFHSAYVEPCRRPADGRYGDNPIRMQHYYQFQVVMKPNPDDFVERYLGSLAAIGIHPEDHDLRLVHDDWESPTLGAWGLGWEIWADGMEITQFTYFQQVGGFELRPVMGEITYGLERICMFIQGVDNVFDLQYNEQFTYGDIFHENEVQFSAHNFEVVRIETQLQSFKEFELECERLCEHGLPLPALDYCLKASHAFNLLDARGAISVNERQGYILRVRNLARMISEAFLANREKLGHPLLARSQTPETAKAKGVAESATPELAAQAPFLLEVGVEEMPARVFTPLLEQLPRLAKKHFGSLNLQMGTPRVFATPRRIALAFEDVLTQQADSVDEVKGPPMRIAKDADGNWTKAALGFAKKAGIDLSTAGTREIKGETYLFARLEKNGRAASEILAEAIPAFLRDIHWYNVMRWGNGETGFVRPVKWLLANLGGAVVPFEFGGIHSGLTSCGHRFLHPGTVAVPPDADGYLAALRKADVIADHEERRELVRELLHKTAAANQLVWREDEGLLHEVTYLVEQPVPILGRFEADFLEIPDEVLVSEMKVHQKYFALTQENGQLANAFVAMANMRCRDEDVIRSGFEKVLRSRFADARFFLREDTKISLADRVEKLEKAIFQADLGSVRAKVGRIGELTGWLADQVGIAGERKEHARQIAALCKSDLTTDMVGEFPDLQGEIGRYYAEREGLPEVVANGLLDHYNPKSVNGVLPGSDEAALVGIADRIDSMVGIFAIGKAPTSSADPYGLRRACLTTTMLVVQRGFRFVLRALLEQSIEAYGETLAAVDRDALLAELLSFFRQRASRLFRELDREDLPGPFAHDCIQAVLAASTPWEDLSDLVRRFEAMDDFRNRADFADVAATFKRCNNIIKEDRESGMIDESLLREAAEQGLFAALSEAGPAIAGDLEQQDYVSALSRVGTLRTAVDTIFDVDSGVMVNAENPALRRNRRLLVQQVAELVARVADFSVIQG